MDIRNQYAFAQNNFVGQTATRSLTPVVVAPSANGEPVLKPCQPDGFIPQNDDVALAYRANAESEWQPIRSVAQFQEIVKSTPPEQLGQNLGVWTDRKSFYVVGSRDGVPQNSEVQPFAERWKGMEYVTTRPLVDKGFRSENRADAEVVSTQVGLDAALISIDPQSFTATPGSFPGREVGFFTEVGKVSRHDIYINRGVGQIAETISHGGGGEGPEVLCDFNLSGAPTYVMPKALGGPDESAQFSHFN